MLWATVIIFRKSPKSKSVFDMVQYIKKHYQHFCSLYRIDFRNFRNDYAFSIAMHQLEGFVPTKKLPARLITLPALAEVTRVESNGIEWQMEGRVGAIQDSDVHVIDKGVAHV